MPNDTLRIGFVGAGGIVRDRHVPGLRQAEGVEFYGVVNRSRASSMRAAEEFGIERVYDDWQELVTDPKVDIVWIGTHPSMHRIVTEAALDAGKHVFTQARMALNYADAKAMYEAAAAPPEPDDDDLPAAALHAGRPYRPPHDRRGLHRRAAQCRRAVVQSRLPRPDQPRSTGGSAGRSRATTRSTSA